MKGLDQHQVVGMMDYHLGLDEVRVPNFGAHTLSAIKTLAELSPETIIVYEMQFIQTIDPRSNYKAAYEKVRGLNEEQVNQIIHAAREESLPPSHVQVGNFNVPAPGQRVNMQSARYIAV